MDYTMGVLLIAAPWLFGFAHNGVETWLPVVLGIGAIGYSLLTRYELGAFPMISINTHLFLDGASGAILAVSPWLFNVSNVTWVPHLVLGLLEVGAALMTQTRPGTVRSHFAGRTTGASGLNF